MVQVEQRYRQYYSQIQMVSSSYQQAAGSGSAKSYTALALHTISKQVRCLKDAIAAQIKATGRSLGEEDEVQARSQHAAALMSENAQMRKTNELLRRQIEELESIKNRKATDVKTYMEATVQPPPPSIRSAMKAPGIIIKPKMVHTVARSHSRI